MKNTMTVKAMAEEMKNNGYLKRENTTYAIWNAKDGRAIRSMYNHENYTLWKEKNL